MVRTDLAKKLRWKVHPTQVPSVRTANGELVLLTGVIKEDLTVGGRSVASEIFVSPDLTGMIIGLDWLRSQGEFVWDFVNYRIKFPDGRWIGLHEERQDAVYVRRIYVAALPAAHQTDVPIRVSHNSWMDEPFVGITKNAKVPSLRHVFSARTVLPPKFTDMKVPVINLDDRSQTIVKGTKLGVLEKAAEIGETEGGDSLSSLEPEPVVNCTKAFKKAEIIDQMMQALPKELNDELHNEGKYKDC